MSMELEKTPLTYCKRHIWGYLHLKNHDLPPIPLWRFHPETTIGRNHRCHIIIPSENISDFQCALYWDGEDACDPIEVLDSSDDGSYINSQLIGQGHIRHLNSGDELWLGRKNYCFIFEAFNPRPDSSYIDEVYDVGRILGTGAFGDVSHCFNRLTGQEFAIKKVRRTKGYQNAVTQEIDVLKSLCHENICSFIDFSVGQSFIYLVLEYVNGGNLAELLKRKRFLPEVECKQILLDIFTAIEYLHKNRVIHRDIKPENVLLTSEGKVKLADFGSSKAVTSLAKTFVGTTLYMAPEILLWQWEGRLYGFSVDCWSTGVVAFQMLSGEYPFSYQDMDDLKLQIRQKRIAWVYLRGVKSKVSPAAIAFLEALLMLEPKKRMSASSALKHVWLKQ